METGALLAACTTNLKLSVPTAAVALGVKVQTLLTRAIVPFSGCLIINASAGSASVSAVAPPVLTVKPGAAMLVATGGFAGFCGAPLMLKNDQHENLIQLKLPKCFQVALSYPAKHPRNRR